MRRTDLDYIVIILLIFGSLYVFISEIIMDTMGLHRFVFLTGFSYYLGLR
ncbi:hypothetical protein [Brasilonema bromeliae]|nr:hypothetical protein [Brasilonema bromeliae]